MWRKRFDQNSKTSKTMPVLFGMLTPTSVGRLGTGEFGKGRNTQAEEVCG